MNLDKIKAGTKNRKEIKWPGTENKVVLRILSRHENQEALFQAARVFEGEKIAYSAATADAFEEEKNVQLLFLALRDADDPEKPLAGSAHKFRQLASRDEIGILVDEYLAFEAECSPNPDNMTPEELDRLLDEVKKKPELIGSISSISTLRRLSTSLASPPSS